MHQELEHGRQPPVVVARRHPWWPSWRMCLDVIAAGGSGSVRGRAQGTGWRDVTNWYAKAGHRVERRHRLICESGAHIADSKLVARSWRPWKPVDYCWRRSRVTACARPPVLVKVIYVSTVTPIHCPSPANRSIAIIPVIGIHLSHWWSNIRGPSVLKIMCLVTTAALSPVSRVLRRHRPHVVFLGAILDGHHHLFLLLQDLHRLPWHHSRLCGVCRWQLRAWATGCTAQRIGNPSRRAPLRRVW